MLINQEICQHLRGEIHDKGFQVKFQFEPDDFIYKSRNDLLSSLCKGKEIIHIGCVDHNIETIKIKLRKGKWLHKILCDRAKRCFGVDIHKEGIKYIAENLNLKDVAAFNIISDTNPAINNNFWDYMLIPDVIEHLNNPIEFLRTIHKKYPRNVNSVVITAPNSFTRLNMKNARRGVECINSDHRFWFTPFTLIKLAVLAGFAVKRIHMCSHGEINRPSFFYPMQSRYPLIRSSIVVELNFS
jgi:hypothetical protein